MVLAIAWVREKERRWVVEACSRGGMLGASHPGENRWTERLGGWGKGDEWREMDDKEK